MSGQVENTAYHSIGKLYAGMTKESIRANIDAMTFKSEQEREKAYNKQIQLFDYVNNLVPEEVDDFISEKEIEAYNKKEKTNRTWKTIGLVVLGVGTTIATGLIFNNKLLKSAGLMSKKEIMGNSINLGNQIATKAANTGSVSLEDIQHVINSQLGNDARKINLFQDKETFINVIKSSDGSISNQECISLWEKSLSMVIPHGSNVQTFLNIRADSIPNSMIANVSAHEYQHALYDAFSFKHNLGALVRNTKRAFPHKLSSGVIKFSKNVDLDKSMMKIPKLSKIEDVSFMLQDELLNLGNLGEHAGEGLINCKPTMKGLLHFTGFKNKKDLHKAIRSLLYEKEKFSLNTSDDIVNYVRLSSLKSILKDEARSYAVGGQSEQKFLEIVGENTKNLSTKSEVYSLLCDEVSKVVSKEANKCLMKGSRKMMPTLTKKIISSLKTSIKNLFKCRNKDYVHLEGIESKPLLESECLDPALEKSIMEEFKKFQEKQR